jgi:hypothetical protein
MALPVCVDGTIQYGEWQSTVTDLLKAFLGNGSVNTFQRATMEDVSQWTNVMASG